MDGFKDAAGEMVVCFVHAQQQVGVVLNPCLEADAGASRGDIREIGNSDFLETVGAVFKGSADGSLGVVHYDLFWLCVTKIMLFLQVYTLWSDRYMVMYS